MDKKKNILILGCGYVGSTLARRWLDDGHEVWAVNRSTERLRNLVSSGLKLVQAQVDSHDWHQRVPVELSLVLNCVSAGGGGLEGYQRSYLGGNRSLCAWAKKSRVGQIIYTSSTGVYPFTDGRIVREEDAGGGLADTGKILWEAEGTLREDGTISDRTTILRLAGIYGPARHYLLDALQRGQSVFPGNGEVFMNLIYLNDIVAAIDLVGKHPDAPGETFNLVDNEPTDKATVVEWLASELGRKKPRFDPELPPQRRMRVNAVGQSPNRRISNEKIRGTLSWEPKYPTYRQGFAELLRV